MYLQQLTLLHDTQMTLAYHWSTFSHWPQRKAFFKKSFSTFSWPMAFNRESFSSSAWLFLLLLLLSKTVSAPFKNSRFQRWICWGAMSCFWANSATLDRSFKASNTTLVLNFDVYFFLVIVVNLSRLKVT